MSKKNSAPPGSTRKELTKEEQDWLDNFNRAYEKNDSKSLAKIVPKDKVVADVIRETNSEHHARRRDIYANQKSVNIQPTSTSSWDESFDSFVEGDESIEHHIEDPTLAPKQQVERYTSEDYNPPSFPNEDGLIDLIDYDRAEAEKKKIKNFSEYQERQKKGKKYDPAS
jgi:flagellar biosynthesis/type III secretory pathway M-ring protein FliF/YscJ